MALKDTPLHVCKKYCYPYFSKTEHKTISSYIFILYKKSNFKIEAMNNILICFGGIFSSITT